MSEILVSALVSTYDSARYLRGCLDDLLQQTLADQLEIVVVDAGSTQDEGRIVREYQDRCRHLVYVRTATRECSSTALNRATALARGRYLTTANTDDRHHPEFLRHLVAALEQQPGHALAYADSLITQTDNETWQRHTARRRYAWPDFTPALGLSCCLFGAQPLWRASIHQQVGLWDPTYRRANDQDLFLRIALAGGAIHVREPLGLFLQRPDSNSGSQHRDATLAEVMAVMARFRRSTSLPVLFPELAQFPDDALAEAACWFELAQLAALGPYTDLAFALQCLQRALAVPVPEPHRAAVQQAFALDTAALLLAAGEVQAAERALRCAGTGPGPAPVAALLAEQRRTGLRPAPRELPMVGLPHPVVEASRGTQGLELGAAGLAFGPVHHQAPWQVFEGPNGVPWAPPEVLVPPAPSPGAVAVRTLGAALATPTPKGPQRVLLVAYGWADSGGGTMLPRAFAHELAQQGHEVAVVYAAAQPHPGLPAYGVHQHREGKVQLFGICNRPAQFMDLAAPEREIDDPAIRATFTAILEGFAPEVVHVWNLHNLGMSLLAVCRARGLPVVFSSNNYWPICPRLYLVSERLERCGGSSPDGQACARCLGQPGLAAAHARRKAAGITMLREQVAVHLAVSRRVAELYVQNGDDPGHVRVLRQEPPQVAALWEAVGRHRVRVPHLDRALRVGFFGSVMAHKGVHVLAQALQLLPEGAVLCVACGDVAPDYLPVLRALDRRGRLQLTGRYGGGQLGALLADVDVVVVPSVWDDCAPFVVAEALAAGCPVVGSRIGGIPDFVQDGSNGLLFAPGDAGDLARCLAAFGRDPGLLGRLQGGIVAPRGLAAFVGEVVGVYGEVVAGALVAGRMGAAARS